jgi:hypothetical protein
MNERFKREREQFKLKESCEYCRHFCAEREACAVMYPPNPHREAVFNNALDGERIYFCKMFEVDDDA